MAEKRRVASEKALAKLMATDIGDIDLVQMEAAVDEGALARVLPSTVSSASNRLYEAARFQKRRELALARLNKAGSEPDDPAAQAAAGQAAAAASAPGRSQVAAALPHGEFHLQHCGASIDTEELQAAIEDAKAAGVDAATLKEMEERLAEAKTTQGQLTMGAALFGGKLRRLAAVRRAQNSVRDRLKQASAECAEALQQLRKQRESINLEALLEELKAAVAAAEKQAVVIKSSNELIIDCDVVIYRRNVAREALDEPCEVASRLLEPDVARVALAPEWSEKLATLESALKQGVDALVSQSGERCARTVHQQLTANYKLRQIRQAALERQLKQMNGVPPRTKEELKIGTAKGLATATQIHVNKAIDDAHEAYVDTGTIAVARLLLRQRLAEPVLVKTTKAADVNLDELLMTQKKAATATIGDKMHSKARKELQPGDASVVEEQLPELAAAIKESVPIARELARWKAEGVAIAPPPEWPALALATKQLQKSIDALNQRATAMTVISEAGEFAAQLVNSIGMERMPQAKAHVAKMLDDGPRQLDALMAATREAKVCAVPEDIIDASRQATTDLRAILLERGRLR